MAGGGDTYIIPGYNPIVVRDAVTNSTNSAMTLRKLFVRVVSKYHEMAAATRIFHLL